ncbi:ankyrin repeat domain-containing protein 61-like [Pseudonaja textilis]|uniref:ankyrin repeat domain-containing protein 61-like n=1 Tax=Pseudonaja textilis TaxID=8673 RepID=UPI000EA83FC6|nr:ankyrin repeat domain-containing protein 61-like [Pseudonaja textilis]XP_026579949.1 ankyrin repeat domain-containing protein 61-like [Pseudonaja textilis]
MLKTTQFFFLPPLNMGNLIGRPHRWENESTDKILIDAIMTNDTSMLQDLLPSHSVYQTVICQEKGRFVQDNTQSGDPERSPPKAECSTENRHRAEERNDGKHLPIKSKKGVKATHADVVGHHDHHPLHLAVAIGCHHLIPDLLKRGARIDDRTKSGQTALHLASRTLNQAAIQTLLHCGAQVNSTTPTTQETPLHLAVHTSSSKAGIVLGADGTCVELLLLNGADVGLKDWKGQAALHHACRNGREDLIHLLLSYGADANAVTSQAESCLFLFLEKASNLKKANILWKLLSLSYPVKLTNAEGRLPQLLDDPHWEPLKDILLQVSSQVWSLQDICKFNIRKVYGGDSRYWLKEAMPVELWDSIYTSQPFSYASNVVERIFDAGRRQPEVSERPSDASPLLLFLLSMIPALWQDPLFLGC